MYVLASAFFVAGIYSFYVGDTRNAATMAGVALVLAGARFILGPQEEASLVRRAGLGVAILFLIVAVTYTILTFLK
ncbi:MAG: hypothetical protein WBM63_11825 [Sedimenticolaceae bacterium]